MKKIVYFHGLETPPGGEKVGFLATKGIVHAPPMKYKELTCLTPILLDVMAFKPDLIVGSSMGAYLAYQLAQHLDTEVILFNPAVHGRSFDLPPLSKGNRKVKGVCALGMKDKIINPKVTLEILKNEPLNFIEIKDMAHRVSFEVFVDIYNKYLEHNEYNS